MPELICHKCNGPLQNDKIGQMSGSDGDVSLTLGNMPCLTCAKCGRHEQPRPRGYDFSPELTLALVKEKSVTFARQEGIFKRKWVCSKCKSDLIESEAAPANWEFSVRLEECQPFEAELTLPTLNCPSCQTKQVLEPAKYDDKVCAATDNAFQSAGVEL